METFQILCLCNVSYPLTIIPSLLPPFNTKYITLSLGLRFCVSLAGLAHFEHTEPSCQTIFLLCSHSCSFVYVVELKTILGVQNSYCSAAIWSHFLFLIAAMEFCKCSYTNNHISKLFFTNNAGNYSQNDMHSNQCLKLENTSAFVFCNNDGLVLFIGFDSSSSSFFALIKIESEKVP